MTHQPAQGQDAAKARIKGLRQRFRTGGLDGLSIAEAMELILSFAAPGKKASVVAEGLLRRWGGVRPVMDAPAEALLRAEGMNGNIVTFVRLIKAAACLYMKERLVGKDLRADPVYLIDYLYLALSGERVERFLAIYLNRAFEAVSIDALYEGTINRTAVYPRGAVERALERGAKAVIFVHNHPSGDPVPSDADMELAAGLESASKAVDLDVIDHIIIGRLRHHSVKAHGWPGIAPPACRKTP